MSQKSTIKFNRELKTVDRAISIPDLTGFDTDLLGWLTGQARQNSLWYLLAHADDGVIWGKVDNGTIRLSSEVFPEVSPPLQAVSLQQVRLFGPQAELYVWRSGSAWQARLINDGDGKSTSCFDEPQILWGNHRSSSESNETFTLVVDGEQGHQHAVPITTVEEQFTRNKQPYRPLRLCVRHYLTEDDQSGQLRITLSRLTNLTVEDAQ